MPHIPIDPRQGPIFPLPLFPPQEHPPLTSFSADPNDKKVKKHSPKTLSSDLFLEILLAQGVIMSQVNPTLYAAGLIFGIGRPLWDYKFNGMVPKKLSTDSNSGDFGKSDMSTKASFAALSLIPSIAAYSISERHPFISSGLVFLASTLLASDLAQKVIRWVHTP